MKTLASLNCAKNLQAMIELVTAALFTSPVSP
jgi:hypothetical protein